MRHSHLPPTLKQLRYLRQLAWRTGQSFASPQTILQASNEIERLTRVANVQDPSVESQSRRQECRQIARELQEYAGDATRVTANELMGYGARAHWSHRG